MIVFVIEPIKKVFIGDRRHRKILPEGGMMSNRQNSIKEEVKQVEIYEKPIFEKEKGLTFPKEIIEQFNGGRFCLQCSNCHGCRD